MVHLLFQLILHSNHVCFQFLFYSLNPKTLTNIACLLSRSPTQNPKPLDPLKLGEVPAHHQQHFYLQPSSAPLLLPLNIGVYGLGVYGEVYGPQSWVACLLSRSPTQNPKPLDPLKLGEVPAHHQQHFYLQPSSAPLLLPLNIGVYGLGVYGEVYGPQSWVFRVYRE